MSEDMRRLMRIAEAAETKSAAHLAFAAAATAIRAKVAAMSAEQQTLLAEALTRQLHDWIEGDGMVAGHERFMEPFRLIASVVTHHHRKALRSLYRGTKMDTNGDDLRAATEAGQHRVVTSTKPLQSWTTKATTAAQFASWQDYAKGAHGVIFQTRASALDILFTMKDVADCLWHIVEGLPYEIKSRYESLSNSEFMDLHYNLERFKDQNEVVAVTPSDQLVLVSKIKII